MSLIDERFLTHRLRSSGTAGILGGVVAAGLWFYRLRFEHRLDWGLFAVLATMAAVKLALMTWYRFTD